MGLVVGSVVAAVVEGVVGGGVVIGTLTSTTFSVTRIGILPGIFLSSACFLLPFKASELTLDEFLLFKCQMGLTGLRVLASGWLLELRQA